MKRALIVDDSRLARTVLSRLLTEHGVAADTAESGEVALEYLKQQRPDVVFLDHNMPGIDGFQALDAIKKNPATATIPVMMYTSQEGELYVGQARALGALGVLPKTLQPVEVTKVLRSLHLIPGAAAEQPAATRVPATPANPAAPTAPTVFDQRPLDAERLGELLEPLFSEQARTLREEMRRGLQRLAAANAPPPPLPAIPEPIETPRRRRERWLPIASALLIVMSATLAYLYFATRASLDEANERVRRLANDTAALSDTRFATVATATPRTAPDGVIEVLEWAVNRGNRYAFSAVPLDDERAAMLTSLTEQLEQLGFAGTVAIDVHVGRFCMNYRAEGTLELAPPDQPAASCEQVGWPENEALALGRRQSIGFANALASATARNPSVRVDAVSRGSSQPVESYPAVNYELTAGAWNTVAAANHRVDVRLVPDAANGSTRR